MANSIIETHMIEEEDLLRVTEGFKRLTEAFRGAFPPGEFDKFKEAVNRINEALSDTNEGESNE